MEWRSVRSGSQRLGICFEKAMAMTMNMSCRDLERDAFHASEFGLRLFLRKFCFSGQY